jgi:hypothetical protein
MKKTLYLALLALLVPLTALGQAITPSNGIQIVQGGNTAGVTAGNALKSDITSVAGVAVTGMLAGSVPVSIVQGAGSGGTAIADEAAVTEGATSFTLGGCEFKTSPTALTTGQGGMFECLADRSLFVNVKDWAGSALGAMANYGTSPGAVLVPGVNAFVTNTIPVTGTFWQATQPVSLATAPALVASAAVIGEVSQNDGCGTTPDNIALQTLPTSATAILTATSCINSMTFSNPDSSAHTLTVTDNAGTPVSYLNALTLSPVQTVTFNLFGLKFTSGVKWSASSALVTGGIVGHH